MGEKQATVETVDRDDAVVYLEGHHVDANVDLTALRRKIDRRLLPYMFCCYVLQFLDKVMLNVSESHCNHQDSVYARTTSTPDLPSLVDPAVAHHLASHHLLTTDIV